MPDTQVLDASAKSRPNTANRIDFFTRTKVKNLYFFQEASHERIAIETGLTISAVGGLINREGWAKEKRAREQRLRKAHDARSFGVDAELVEAIAAQSEELALSGIAQARKEVESGGDFAARNFQSWSGGVKNFVQVAKALREPSNALPSEGPTNFNFFFASPAASNTSNAQSNEEPKKAEVIDLKEDTQQ